ncbi:MAG: DUF362 domain-containing protein [Chloroflexi bacterium]|nr:DUF362 domain-containing protein [Chloroflexota bacterium]
MIDPKSWPGRGQVAILKTSPETVLDDYARLMHLAHYQENLPKQYETLLKINISWQIWYPSCSTAPWQLEAVTKTILADGYSKDKIIATHNDTVVVNGQEGQRNNRHKLVQDKYGLRTAETYLSDVEWVTYEPKRPFLVLDQVYPHGVRIPKFFYGKNVLHLPTMKTHVFTHITGAMKNAFGGLLDEKRHWTHSVIDETLVDLLQIQQDIHTGLFAVMDGTMAGEGPGPRATRWHVKDVIMASSDPVALDAAAAKIMGIPPLNLKFIRAAHERGLGVGDPREIKFVGDTAAADEDWHFSAYENTFASWGQHQIYHGPLHPFEHFLLRTPLVPWSYAASNIYHNWYWYPFVGKKRMEAALRTKWGRLLQEKYSPDRPINTGYGSRVPFAAATAGTTAAALALLIGALLATRRSS